MNEHMWRRDVTQANVDALRARGVHVIEPETGELACGDYGQGRLAEVDALVEALLAEARRGTDLEGVRVLVFAGATQEPIDPVRYISNRASGKTGHAIAEEAARRGADVTLVIGPNTLPAPYGVKVVHVMTALQMAEAVEAHYDEADAVVASAAVSDFRPAEPSFDKVKKDEAELGVPLVRNPDILAGLGQRKGDRLLVGFAAETRDVLDEARAKLAAKNLDLVVANNVSEAGLGFGSDVNRVWLVDETGEAEMPVLSKKTIARLLWDKVAGKAREAHALRSGEEQDA
jgi:phosphopantothenoylcysteine decarboxylase/phosphopantothenate--cysteine ligase